MKRPTAVLRFSLRATLVALTVFCLWLGYLSYGAHRQKIAVERIRRLGGRVTYDWQMPIDVGGGLLADPTGPHAPRWLRSLLGEDLFQTVIAIYFRQKKVDASVLDGLPHLQRVVFRQCNVSDVSAFADLKQLQSLSLERNQITDLSPLSSLRDLRELDLSDNLIVNCEPLCELKGLMLLDVQGNELDKRQIDRLVKALPDCNKTWSAPK